MACQDCFKNCGDSYTSDKCVEYTGPEIPLLGICTGDTLSIVEAKIFEAIIGILEGEDIILDDVTLDNCPYLLQKFTGKNKTIENLIQLLVDEQCSLKEQLDGLSQDSQSFDIRCLTGLPTNPTSVDILQAVVIELCNIKTSVNAFPSTYVKLSDLPSLVNQIIQQNTALASSSFPKLIPVPYIGPLSNFDNTGKGLGQYAGWFMMNGLNGTQDWRGRKVVGAIRNIPGGTLDAEVNPSFQGASTNYGVGDKFGRPFVTLTPNEIPAHSHSVNDPGHSHNIQLFKNDSRGGDQQDTAYLRNNTGAGPATVSSNAASTNITIGNTGGGLAHENRDPSVGAVWIVKL